MKGCREVGSQKWESVKDWKKWELYCTKWDHDLNGEIATAADVGMRSNITVSFLSAVVKKFKVATKKFFSTCLRGSWNIEWKSFEQESTANVCEGRTPDGGWILTIINVAFDHEFIKKSL